MSQQSQSSQKACPRTDSRPSLGNLIDNSTIIQPLLNPTPAIFKPSSNHHSSASHQLFVRHPPRRPPTIQPPPQGHPSHFLSSAEIRPPAAHHSPSNSPSLTPRPRLLPSAATRTVGGTDFASGKLVPLVHLRPSIPHSLHSSTLPSPASAIIATSCDNILCTRSYHAEV